MTRPSFSPFARAVLVALGLGTVACAIFAALVDKASSHDAAATPAKPLGWTYPFSCCSGFDCRRVSKAAIAEKPEGYVIARTGEVIGYSDTRLKNSPDGAFHWCSVAGLDDSRTICLFAPPRGY